MSQNINKKGRKSIPKKSIAATRMKRLRERRRETQKDIGGVIGYTAQTYARYEKGERGILDSDLEKLAKHWGVLPEYLKGETDVENDPVAFRLEQEQKTVADFSKAIERNEYDIRRARLENLFTLCGFRYQDQFDNVVTHTLSDETELLSPASFNDNELDAILSRIHDLIELEMYRKQAKEKALHSD